MIMIKDIIVHPDVFKECFVCDLEQCKGICCVEGDFGAPLEEGEVREIDKNLSAVKPYMTKAARKLLSKSGFYERDPDADLVTQCLDGRDCVFAYPGKDGIYKCAIETAWEHGASSFRKPVSCHLYPIRVNKIKHLEGVSYNRWNICKPACTLGNKLGVPLYVFLKEPLIRKYGEDWYKDLVSVADEVVENF